MTSTSMFINNAYTINQNADVYGTIINDGTYDYTFLINVASFTNGNISKMFSNASFIQNSVNIDNYDINLTLDAHNTFANWSTAFNNQPLVTIGIGNSNKSFATLDPDLYQTIGDRLLEVVAHKLFGHGQARAAIKNDSEFYTHDNEVWDHLSTTVATNTIRNDIFNQYVATGRYNAYSNFQMNGVDVNNTDNTFTNLNDVNTWVNFNFNGLTFDYPLYLVGNMLHDVSLTNAEIAVLQNGPNVGGTLLQNGLYNVPILVRFHQ